MADYRDVMEVRHLARESLGTLDSYGEAIEDGRTSDPALAVLLGARAICLHLHALSTTLEYCKDSMQRSQGVI